MNKISSLTLLALGMINVACNVTKNPASNGDASANHPHLFVDVHQLEPGKIPVDAVAGAHQKDLQTQGKYGVNIEKYWIDQTAGRVYCLAEAKDSAALYQTHKEAHGLVPQSIREVSGGIQSVASSKKPLFLDVHSFGAGKMTAKRAASVHKRDLAIQEKYNVTFVNYWFDKKAGTMMCLVHATDSSTVAAIHKEAHGYLPKQIHEVKEGL